MVVPLVAGALVLLGLIAVISGVVLVSAYQRDIETGKSEEVISTNTDSTVDNILSNNDLSGADKIAALKQYFDSTTGNASGGNGSGGSGTSDQDLKKYAVLGFLGLAAISVLGK